jgi:6-phosphofructokinase 1
MANQPPKGNLLVGQSGGPTAVINASLAGVVQEAHNHPQIDAIYGMVHGIEGVLKDALIDLGQETPQTVELLAHTPASALGSCRHKVTGAEYEQILERFRAHNVRYFVYIGGNDSMDTCHKVSALAQHADYDLQVMGVPKTMDNDLAYTDHCPGFGSAARFLALATRDTGRDLEAMATFDDVTILEALGRNAGWLTASAALGKGDEDEAPHLVYVPEIPFDQERFLQDVARVHGRLGRVFVVVSEGIRDAQGVFIGQHAVGGGGSDRFGHIVHSLTTGVAAYLTDRVREGLGLQARFLRPGLIGRALSTCVSETDRQEALRVGRQAVAQLAAGHSGSMVTLERLSDTPYAVETGLAPLEEVANAEKLLPRDHMNSPGTMITDAFRRYALPLIDGPLPPLARLQSVRIPKT